MKKTILLIDTNSAVQAITSLALNRIGVNVEQLTDPSAAIARVRDLRPHMVLCASDMKGIDALELCREMKSDKALRRIPFVLLAGGEQGADIADDKVVDALLYKPFKSEQLRHTVQNLLTSTAQELDESDHVAIYINNTLTREITHHFVSKRNTEVSVFETAEALVAHAEKTPVPLTVIEWDGKSKLDWFDPNTMGTLIVLTYDEKVKDSKELPLDIRVIVRPLSQAKLERGFESFLPEEIVDTDIDIPPLESNEQALLAAKISVAVYQRLLNQDALKNRSWDEACAAVGAEALRVCLEQEG